MKPHPMSQVVALVVLAATPSTQVLAADAATCQRYANQADKDSLYRERSCPQIPYNADWSRDRNDHYNWCLNAAEVDLEAKTEARGNALIDCGVITTWTPREKF